jgi:predicted GNAT superfamily acetyltransferase/predicted GIY-YIG superfamily endonuclease
MWHCRLLKENAEFEQVGDLESIVWSLEPRDALPASMLHASVHNGGFLAGAYDADQLIGFSFGFPVRRGSRWLLWSHVAGVHPDYQSRGVGFDLKQFQRRWALENQYTSIAWTFDPLQSRNAYFNLHRLGAEASIYHIDFYGEMTDGLNAGLPSDRLEVVWPLNTTRSETLAQGISSPVANPQTEMPRLLYQISAEALCLDGTALDSAGMCLAEIPADIAAVKRSGFDLALQWRLQLRQALQMAFERGYKVADVLLRDGRTFYVLVPQQPWFLYVVECADGTLYTGITPDVSQRIAKHNAGKGAAYTAARRPVRLVAAWCVPHRKAAMQAEVAFKRQSRAEKQAHIAQKLSFRSMPFIDSEQ